MPVCPGTPGGAQLPGALARYWASQLKRQTIFLFYSQSGLGKKAVELLREAGILVIDPEKLADFEVF